MTTLGLLYTFLNNVQLSRIGAHRTENKTAADIILMLNATERLFHVLWNNLIYVLYLISSNKMISGLFIKTKTC